MSDRHLQLASDNGGTSSVLERLAYRSALLYAGLFMLSWSTLLVEWPAPLERHEPVEAVQRLYAWLTTGVLHADAYYIPHVGMLLTIGVAVIGGVLWARVDESRERNIIVADLSRIAIRYALAVGMFAYGFQLLFAVAVRPPAPVDWLSMYGEMTARDVMELGI